MHGARANYSCGSNSSLYYIPLACLSEEKIMISTNKWYFKGEKDQFKTAQKEIITFVNHFPLNISAS